jgi:hypothetical protein
MKWTFLLIGIAVGAFTAFVGFIYLDIRTGERDRKQPIVFAGF